MHEHVVIVGATSPLASEATSGFLARGDQLTLIGRSDGTAAGSSAPGIAYVTAEQVHVPQPSYPIDLFVCGECVLAQLNDVSDPEILYGSYIYQTSSSLGSRSRILGSQE